MASKHRLKNNRDGIFRKEEPSPPPFTLPPYFHLESEWERFQVLLCVGFFLCGATIMAGVSIFIYWWYHG